jgi:hypothetical protein
MVKYVLQERCEMQNSSARWHMSREGGREEEPMGVSLFENPALILVAFVLVCFAVPLLSR